MEHFFFYWGGGGGFRKYRHLSSQEVSFLSSPVNQTTIPCNLVLSSLSNSSSQSSLVFKGVKVFTPPFPFFHPPVVSLVPLTFLKYLLLVLLCQSTNHSFNPPSLSHSNHSLLSVLVLKTRTSISPPKKPKNKQKQNQLPPQKKHNNNNNKTKQLSTALPLQNLTVSLLILLTFLKYIFLILLCQLTNNFSLSSLFGLSS